jgi:hypothetical protein
MSKIQFVAGACLALIAATGSTAATRGQPVARTQEGGGIALDHATDRLARVVFPLISAMQRSPAWQEALISDAAMRQLADARRQRIAACQPQPACAVEARLWTPADLDAMGAAVSRLGKRLPQLPVVRGDTIEAALRRELGGINHVLGTYGLGTAPRYPKIDSAIWPASSHAFRDSVVTAIAITETSTTPRTTLFDESRRLALALLDVNDRTEAATFEPLNEGENAATIRAAAMIDWSKYRYTAIIVPGAGPDDPDTPLSPGGKLRVALAAARFRAGLAPFIIVSGGNVHPNRTRFTEAVEMRRALIDRFSIPAERIVIDPYARHTTTNLRNAVRRLAAMKAPLDRQALIVTSKDQLAYILGATFATRNQQELGYEPGTVGAATSDVEVPFTPSARSLEVDPADPLDP